MTSNRGSINFDILFKSAKPIEFGNVFCFSPLREFMGAIEYKGNATHTIDEPTFLRYNIKHRKDSCTKKQMLGYFKYLFDKGWGEFIDNKSPKDILDRGLLVPISLPMDIFASTLTVFRYGEMNWNVQLFHYLQEKWNIHPDVLFMVVGRMGVVDWCPSEAYCINNPNHQHTNNSVRIEDISNYIHNFPYPSTVLPITKTTWSCGPVFNYFRVGGGEEIFKMGKYSYNIPEYEYDVVSLCKEIERRCL